MAYIDTETVRAVKKSAFVGGDEVPAAICAFVHAPEGTEVTVETRDIDGQPVQGYALSWEHVAKPRAPRKPKAVAAV